MPSLLLTLALAAPTAGVGYAQERQALLQRYDCYICHADAESKTGPALVEVAARYRQDPKGAAALTAMVKKGAHGSGPWHMPPMPQVPEADARKTVDYILTLKP